MKRMIPFVVSAFALVGCSGSDESPVAEDTASSTAALSAAVPKQEWMQLTVANLDPSLPSASSPTSSPAALPSACQPGETASLAQVSRQVATSTNSILASILTTVGNITSNPPTMAVIDHAVWGPITSPESPSIYKLDVHKQSDGEFAFLLSARPKDLDVWKGLFHGHTRVVDKDHRAGELEVDLAAIHAADPAKNEARTGRIAVKFGNVEDNIVIDMTFGGASGPGMPPTDAKYEFARAKDGNGAFRFVAHSTDPSAPAERLFSIETKWNAAGAGMSHATDYASPMPKPNGTVECWAPNAGLVFKAVDGVAGSGAGGDPSCCPKE